MENSKIRQFTGILLLPLAMFFCGLLSVMFGKELCWDLANYHYYNPYAFFNERTQLDFWPSTFIVRHLNPTIDFLTYFLINHCSPLMTEFFLGAIHGINFWLLFLIARLFLHENKISLALLLALLGMYGPTALPGIGSFQNDNLVSIFVLSFVFLFIRGLQDYIADKKFPALFLFFSGLLLGIGVGLKYTALLFALGALLASVILPISVISRVRFVALLTFSIGIGVLISAGYWMHLMWQQHHNPLFPYFNHIFQAVDFPAVNWRDTRFLPKGLWQTLFYPFYFSWDGRTSDLSFRDFRFLVLYVLFVIAAVHWVLKKLAYQSLRLTLPTIWLYIFFIVSYVIWQCYFSIARYLVALEMLSPLIIYLLISQLIPTKQVKTIVVTMVFYSLFFFMVPIAMIRASFYQSTFFNVKIPQSVNATPKALVLIAYGSFMKDIDPRPQAYLIPFFPASWQFIGIPFWSEKYSADKPITEKIRELIHHYHEKIFLLTADKNMPELYHTAEQFGLLPAGSCEIIESDRQKLSNQKVLLCPVAKAT